MRRFVLGLAVAVAAALPTVAQADDQRIAEFIKSKLQAHQQAGNLRGFNIDLKVEQGTVWFTGYAANQQQEDLILQTAQQAGHLGATQIVDDIEIKTSVVEPSSATMTPVVQQAPVAQQVNYQVPTSPIATGAPLGVPAQLGNGIEPSYGPMNGSFAPVSQVANNTPMPMPMGYTGDQGMGGAPNLPGYAWPAYAASPNYAAVNYPKQYSPSAWPYIGPFYPYPQVPMGWRRVELQWDDGWWFLDFHDK
jgi:hypothetical protein